MSSKSETDGSPLAVPRPERRAGAPWKRIVLLAALVLVVVVFFAADLGRYLGVDALKAGRAYLLDAYAAHRAAFILAYVLLYAAQTALSLPGAMILTLAGGAVFGPWAGTLIVNVGATAGATAAAWLARYLLRAPVERRLGERGRRLSAGFAQDGLNYLLFLRFVPLFPFWLVNLAAGLTRLPLRTFVVGTALGILPGSFVYTYAGSQLGRLQRAADIVSPGMLLAFVLLGLMALVPVIHRKLAAKRASARRPG